MKLSGPTPAFEIAMPWPVVGSMVPPLMVTLPPLLVRATPFAPPLDDTLSKVADIAELPPLRLRPGPAELLIDTLSR